MAITETCVNFKIDLKIASIIMRNPFKELAARRGRRTRKTRTTRNFFMEGKLFREPLTTIIKSSIFQLLLKYPELFHSPIAVHLRSISAKKIIPNTNSISSRIGLLTLGLSAAKQIELTKIAVRINVLKHLVKTIFSRTKIRIARIILGLSSKLLFSLSFTLSSFLQN